MIKNLINLDIYGSMLNLHKLEKYENDFLTFERKTDIETRGKYKGEFKKYNSISIKVPNTICDFSERIHWVLDKYEIIRDEIKYQKEEQGDDLTIVFMIIIYWNAQCNLSFEPELIKRFHSINETINISCYELDDDEFSKMPGPK